MLQRNPGSSPLVLPTLDPPQTVAPGDVIDHPDPLGGFELVVDKTAPKPVKPAAASPAAAASDAAKEA